ncbi:MAG: addiction module protein [Thermoanaerobaculia bacterium]
MAKDDEAEADQDEIDRLWALEAEDRIAAVERGEMAEIPGEEVFPSLKFRPRG